MSLSYLRNEVDIVLHVIRKHHIEFKVCICCKHLSDRHCARDDGYSYSYSIQPPFEIDAPVNKDQKSVVFKDQMSWSHMHHRELLTNRYVMLSELLSFCKPQIPHQNDREK